MHIQIFNNVHSPITRLFPILLAVMLIDHRHTIILTPKPQIVQKCNILLSCSRPLNFDRKLTNSRFCIHAVNIQQNSRETLLTRHDFNLFTPPIPVFCLDVSAHYKLVLIDYRQHFAQRKPPVFNLLRGWFWGFSPRRGDMLHRWGDIWHGAKFHRYRCNDKAVGPENWYFYSDLTKM